MIEAVELSKIRPDASAQPRSAIQTDKVSEYVDRMAEADIFPPLITFFDGSVHWLADGFHRFHAAMGLGLTEFECDIREGGLREAVLYSCGANAGHGIPRTNEDKRRAVMKLLQDVEWSHWSDREIARQCRVGHPLVADLRSQLAPLHLEEIPDRPRTVARGGTTYTQNTAAIGKPTANATYVNHASTELAEDDYEENKSAGLIQHERDLENGFISSGLWEVERIIRDLPNAEDAARRFPRHHRHTLTKASILGLSEWLRRFANAYTEESSNVAAE